MKHVQTKKMKEIVSSAKMYFFRNSPRETEEGEARGEQV